MVSGPLDAEAPAGMPSAAIASPAIRYLLLGCIGGRRLSATVGRPHLSSAVNSAGPATEVVAQPGGGLRELEPTGDQILGELDSRVAQTPIGGVRWVMAQVLGDPPRHVRPAEHRRAHVADEVPHLADAPIVEPLLEPPARDAVAAAAGQVGESTRPLADPTGLLTEVEQELVDVVVGIGQVAREPRETLAGRAAQVKARRRIRIVTEWIYRQIREDGRCTEQARQAD